MRTLMVLFRKGGTLLVLLGIFFIVACSSQEHEASKEENKNSMNESEDKSNKEVKPQISTSKPKTSKAITDLKTIPKNQQADEIKEIPIGRPLEEMQQKKEDESDESDESQNSSKESDE